MVSSETSVTRPPRMPARSETKNQWWFSMVSQPVGQPRHVERCDVVDRRGLLGAAALSRPRLERDSLAR